MMKKLLLTILLAMTGCQVSHPTFYQWGDKKPVPTSGETETTDQTPGAVRGEQPIGAPEADAPLDLSVHVGLRNEKELDDYLREVTDPQNPKFGQFLSHEEFAALYLPTHEQMDAVRHALEAKGLKVDAKAKGAVLRAHASVESAERAFNVRLRHYENPHDKRTMRAPSAPISVPAGLGIVAIHGLASAPHRNPKHVVGNAGHTAHGGPLLPYKTAAIRSGYSIPGSLDGAGAVIGMLELDGYRRQDIASYAHQNGIGMPKMTNINMDGYDGRILDAGSQLEVTLDIELAMAMAPRAAEIVVYGADQSSSDTAWFDIWNEMANPTKHPLVRTISVSWGTPEDYASQATMNSEHAILKQMAAQGQSVFVASGDNGAYDDGSHLVTDDPASQRYAIAVGGTNLRLNSDGTYHKESAWDNGGGGLSSIWLAPPWQVSAARPGVNAISSRLRNVPDVSLDADPNTGYAVYMNGMWTAVGGTSCAAPLWAGYWASIQQARSSAGAPPLGFAAPILWKLGSQGIGFHDIADGSSNGHYKATQGYDQATGFGTLDGTAMRNALVPAPKP